MVTFTMDELVEKFITEKGDEFFEAEKVCGQCYIVSQDFRSFLTRYGVESDILLLTGYLGDPHPNPLPVWKNNERSIVHCVALVDDMTYDFTARQFDQEGQVPKLIALEELDPLWMNVSIGSEIPFPQPSLIHHVVKIDPSI